MTTDKSSPDLESTMVDPESWVDAYGDYLYRYAFSRLRDSNAAEEVVQETFLAGVRYREQFLGHGSIQGWLLGILKRKIVDYVRLRAKHNRAGAYDDETDPSTQLFDAQGNWRAGALGWSPAPDQRIEMKELLASRPRVFEKSPAGSGRRIYVKCDGRNGYG